MQVHGVIDENTLVWGQGLMDWLPVRNVRTLVPQIRTPEGASYHRSRPRLGNPAMLLPLHWPVGSSSGPWPAAQCYRPSCVLCLA